MVSSILQEVDNHSDVCTSEGIVSEFIDSDMTVAKINYQSLDKDRGNVYAALRSYVSRHNLDIKVVMHKGDILLKKITKEGTP